MSDRFKEAERMMAATRKEIPRAAVKWLAAARSPLEKLTMAALSGEVTDEEFVKMVEEFSESLPGLLDKMDHAAIAEPLEAGMGAAMANGIARRIEDTPGKKVKAKLPWERDAWLASREKGKGKRCGNSYISANKECRIDLGKVWNGSKESMEARAIEGMKSLPKVLSHPETGFEFEMNGNAIGKSVWQAKGEAEDLMAASKMGELFLNSKKNPPEPDRKNHHGVKAFHTFSTKVRIGGRNREAVITVTEFEPNNDPSKQMPHFKLFRLRSMKKGT